MAHEIIKNESEDESQMVSIGNEYVSMQLLQGIYNEITGKKETATRIFRENHQANFNDLKTLNIKFQQLYEQYNVVSKNCAVTIFYLNDCRDQFSSFERFSMYDQSSLSPIENIQLEYDFLIILPSTKKPQPYNIRINLNSRVTVKKRSELEGALRTRFFINVAKVTGRSRIEYIDYTVARSFDVAIEEWFRAIPKSHSPKYLEWLKEYQEYIPFFFKFLTGLTVLLTIYFNHKSILGENPTFYTLFGASILSITIVYLSLLAAGRIGYTAHDSIDFIQPASGLKLNRGDELAFDDFYSSNRRSIIKLVFSVFAMVAINIFSGWLALKLGL